MAIKGRHSQTTHAAKLHWNAAKRSKVVETRIVPPCRQKRLPRFLFLFFLLLFLLTPEFNSTTTEYLRIYGRDYGHYLPNAISLGMTAYRRKNDWRWRVVPTTWRRRLQILPDPTEGDDYAAIKRAAEESKKWKYNSGMISETCYNSRRLK